MSSLVAPAIAPSPWSVRSFAAWMIRFVGALDFDTNSYAFDRMARIEQDMDELKRLVRGQGPSGSIGTQAHTAS